LSLRAKAEPPEFVRRTTGRSSNRSKLHHLRAHLVLLRRTPHPSVISSSLDTLCSGRPHHHRAAVAIVCKSGDHHPLYSGEHPRPSDLSWTVQIRSCFVFSLRAGMHYLVVVRRLAATANTSQPIVTHHVARPQQPRQFFPERYYGILFLCRFHIIFLFRYILRSVTPNSSILFSVYS
jgi:hypothetical protein